MRQPRHAIMCAGRDLHRAAGMIDSFPMLVVDPWHWLNANGDIPTDNLRLRRQMLRIARFIEYGGPLKELECRETLMECRKRPRGVPCTGLMWVAKTERDEIQAFCRVAATTRPRFTIGTRPNGPTA